MEAVVLWLALTAASLECLLLTISMIRPDFEFWPPPSGRSWQKKVFFGLFRAFCGTTILVALFVGDRWTGITGRG